MEKFISRLVDIIISFDTNDSDHWTQLSVYSLLDLCVAKVWADQRSNFNVYRLVNHCVV